MIGIQQCGKCNRIIAITTAFGSVMLDLESGKRGSNAMWNHMKYHGKGSARWFEFCNFYPEGFKEEIYKLYKKTSVSHLEF